MTIRPPSEKLYSALFKSMGHRIIRQASYQLTDKNRRGTVTSDHLYQVNTIVEEQVTIKSPSVFIDKRYEATAFSA